MTLHWSAATGGIYDTEMTSGALPDDAVEISAETHAAMMAALADGLEIGADADTGAPVLQAPPEPSEEALATVARARRQAEISGLRWMVERHLDQLALASDPTISNEAYLALLTHIQALRDVPEQPGFPVEFDWPVLPNLIPVSGA